MSFYLEMADVAVDLLNEFGRKAELIRLGPSVKTEWGESPGAEVPYDCTIAVFDYELSERNNTSIQQGDMMVLISPDIAIAPATGDRIQIDGKEWEAVSVEIVAPAGISVVYEAQVRAV